MEITTRWVADKAITNTKLGDVPEFTIKGRNSSGIGTVTDLTISDVKTLLDYQLADVAGNDKQIVYGSGTSLTSSSSLIFDYTNIRLGIGVTPTDIFHIRNTTIGQNVYAKIESTQAVDVGMQLVNSTGVWRFRNENDGQFSFIRDGVGRPYVVEGDLSNITWNPDELYMDWVLYKGAAVVGTPEHAYRYYSGTDRWNFNSTLFEIEAPADATTLSNHPTGGTPLAIATVGYVNSATSGGSLWQRNTTILSPQNAGDSLSIDAAATFNAAGGLNNFSIKKSGGTDAYVYDAGSDTHLFDGNSFTYQKTSGAETYLTIYNTTSDADTGLWIENEANIWRCIVDPSGALDFWSDISGGQVVTFTADSQDSSMVIQSNSVSFNLNFLPNLDFEINGVSGEAYFLDSNLMQHRFTGGITFNNSAGDYDFIIKKDSSLLAGDNAVVYDAGLDTLNIESNTNITGDVNITGTAVLNGDELATQADLQAMSGADIIDIAFKNAYNNYYHEFTYTSGDLTQVDIWETNGKITKLFTKVLTYTSGDLTQVVTTDEVNTKTLTKTLTYSSGVLNTVTRTYS